MKKCGRGLLLGMMLFVLSACGKQSAEEVDAAKNEKMTTSIFEGTCIVRKTIEVCPTCGGSRKGQLEVCSFCNGDGNCVECGGTGNCNLCGGTGIWGVFDEPCPGCDGSGNCDLCDGSGSCAWCKGNGHWGYYEDCSSCGSAGYIIP